MMRPIFLLFILFSNAVIAQESILDHLKQSNIPIGYISYSRIPIVSERDNQFLLHTHKLIKAKSGLYTLIDGTGRLYQQKVTDSAIQWIRIDSTTHFGYNIAAFPFSYQDKIYNLGGYGLWRINGQLRVFNKEESTWDIVKLNKEIPFLFDEKINMVWYDYQKGNIYLGYSIHRNEAVKTKEIDETTLDFTVRKLDLTKKEWSDLGTLNSTLKDKIQTIVTITMSPWGQLVTLGDKINLIDYERNKLLLLNISKPGYQTIFRKKAGNIFYFKDTILYFGNTTHPSLDSISFSYSDFMDTGIPVFASTSQRPFYKSTFFLIFGILSIVGISGWRLSRKYGIYLKKSNHLDNQSLLSKPVGAQFFDEPELSLLKLILRNTEAGRLTSIEEINKVIGVTKRSPEIQKKQRSDVITSINQKYNFVHPDQQTIIQKQRSSEDGRSFDYFIAYKNLETIKSLLPTSTD